MKQLKRSSNFWTLNTGLERRKRRFPFGIPLVFKYCGGQFEKRWVFFEKERWDILGRLNTGCFFWVSQKGFGKIKAVFFTRLTFLKKKLLTKAWKLKRKLFNNGRQLGIENSTNKTHNVSFFAKQAFQEVLRELWTGVYTCVFLQLLEKSF